MNQKKTRLQDPELIAQERRRINDDLMVDESQLYAGPKGQLRQWFDEGYGQKADFLLIARDTFDNTLYSQYASSEAESTSDVAQLLQAEGNTVMEIYDLGAPRESQSKAHRAWNNEQTREKSAKAAQERSKEQNTSGTSARRDISSQAGLNSYVGGQAKTLPTVPEPGEPGSRFNPVVVSREEQAARRSAQGTPVKAAAKKSLDIGMPPGLIQGVPPEILNAAGREQRQGVEEPGVAEAAARGFAGGFVAGTQQTPQSGRTPITIDPASERQRLGIRKFALERDQLALYTTTPGATRDQKQAQLTEDLAQVEESVKALGQGATDRPAPAPIQEASVPGVSQPLIVEALDTVQGKDPVSGADPAQSRARVVMDPKHLAVLAELDNQPEDAFDRSGGRYDH